MIFTVVFRNNKSLVYENNEELYCETHESYNKDVKISFHIPFSRSISIYSAYVPLPRIVMSLYSAHIIFHDIIYCSKLSNAKKCIEIRKVLQNDIFFIDECFENITLYTKLLSKCKLNKIFNAKC